MISLFKRLSRKKNKTFTEKAGSLFPEVQPPGKKPVEKRLAANVDYLLKTFANCCDLVMRPLKMGKDGSLTACIIYFDGIVNQDTLGENIMRAVMIEGVDLLDSPEDPLYTRVYDRLLTVGEVKLLRDLNNLIGEVLNGQLGLILDGQEVCFSLGIKGGKTRGVEEASSEAVVRGPRDGFTEDIRVNTALIRRRVKSPRLKFEKLTIGTLTRTEVNIAYIEGLVMENLVAEIKQRLQRIEIDGIIESGYIEEFIEDTPKSLFGQTAPTERPDRAAVALLEGRAVILIDNTPYVLMVPTVFPMLLGAAEDYYTRFTFSSLIRILRLISLNVALLLPSLYIAVTTFHQEMLPTQLLVSFAGVREGLPFPIFAETLTMEFTFEVLREAGVRLPRQVGQAVSIVGALVIGEAAVNAGLVSPTTVIIVSLTAISNFTIPIIEGANTIRILRFPLMILAGAFGFIGVTVGLLLILVHLCSLRSFGVPYLNPIAPLQTSDLKDTFIRVPWWYMRRRPVQLAKSNAIRQGQGGRGGTPEGKMGQ